MTSYGWTIALECRVAAEVARRRSELVDLLVVLVGFDTRVPDPHLGPRQEAGLQAYLADRPGAVSLGVELWEPDVTTLPDNRYPIPDGHQADWRRDIELVERVREEVGSDVELMADANQGWRMAGDRRERRGVATASQCARALEPLGVYWLEEPLRTDDVDGYAALRRRTSLRIAAPPPGPGLGVEPDLDALESYRVG